MAEAWEYYHTGRCQFPTAPGCATARRAASKDEQFHGVEGANHMSLYDVSKFVDEAASVLGPFFKAKL